MKILFTIIVFSLLTNASGALARVDMGFIEELCTSTGGLVDSSKGISDSCVCAEGHIWMDNYGCVISSSSGIDYSENYTLIVVLGSVGIMLMVFLYVGLMYRR